MEALEKKIADFLKARHWDKLRPADLAKSIMIEGAELLELFQWENLDLETVKKDKKKMGEIKKELADVLIYCLQMAILLRLKPEQIIRQKLTLAAKKYPAKRMRAMKDEARPDYWEIKKKFRQK